MAIRKARGLEVVKSPFQELYEGSRPSLHGLTPAAYLPIVREDKRHEDDPIVIEPGTLVGLDSAGNLVPASTTAFNLSYTALDVTWGVKLQDGTTAVAAGNTESLAAVKPIGVVTAPVYSKVLADSYTNYKRDLTPSILSGNYSILVPATTTAENAIASGDLVLAVNGRFSKIGDPADSAALTDAELAVQRGEFNAGRCIKKHLIATGTSGAGTLASASDADGAGRFDTLSKVNTVPGLGLTGSDTRGIPQMVWQHGITDASGDLDALEIRIDL